MRALKPPLGSQLGSGRLGRRPENPYFMTPPTGLLTVRFERWDRVQMGCVALAQFGSNRMMTADHRLHWRE